MRAARGRRLFGTVALAAALAGAAGALWTKRAGVSELDWASAGPVFALAAVLFALAPLVQAAGFWLILRALGCASPPGETLALWARGFLLRYAPTGALGYVHRIRERERVGADSAQMWTATAYWESCSWSALWRVPTGCVRAAGPSPASRVASLYF